MTLNSKPHPDPLNNDISVKLSPGNFKKMSKSFGDVCVNRKGY